jgi:hypothetical protein
MDKDLKIADDLDLPEGRPGEDCPAERGPLGRDYIGDYSVNCACGRMSYGRMPVQIVPHYDYQGARS